MCPNGANPEINTDVNMRELFEKINRNMPRLGGGGGNEKCPGVRGIL
jgi:hypothetical protein